MELSSPLLSLLFQRILFRFSFASSYCLILKIGTQFLIRTLSLQLSHLSNYGTQFRNQQPPQWGSVERKRAFPSSGLRIQAYNSENLLSKHMFQIRNISPRSYEKGAIVTKKLSLVPICL